MISQESSYYKGSSFLPMRYHYERPENCISIYGRIYICDHPAYSRCTLYKIGNRGLAVIQQRYDILSKCTYWTEIDPDLTDTLYLHPKFKEYFDKYAEVTTDGLYPTVTIRQIMWALKLKPLKRQAWETAFDHVPI
mgnify:CR=1 FL=1